MRTDRHTLTMTRRFSAPMEKVWRALTDPEWLTRWWAPRGWITPKARLDPRVGGTYRFGMREEGGGEMMYVHGTYREFDPPRRMVCTYVWEAGGAGERWRPMGLIGRETVVTITLAGTEGGTELTLTHALFPNAEACDAHRGGWNSNFDCLEGFLAGG